MRRASRVLMGSVTAGIIVAAVCVFHLLAADLGLRASNQVSDVLISRQLMQQEGIRVGDIVTLAVDPAGTRAAQFRVVDSYEPTPDPMKFSVKRLDVRLHLPDLLALSADAADPMSAESVNSLNVALANPADAATIASLISARTAGLVVRPTTRANEDADTFVILDRFHWAIAVVTVVGSTAFLLALMVMRAEERREVIGILRLMGMSSRSILLEVLLEGLLIAIAGALFGVLLAVATEGAINRFFQWRYDTTLVFVRVTPSIVRQSVAFAIPLGVIAGLAASWTLLRRDVVSLVRR